MVQLAPPSWMGLASLLVCLSSRELKGPCVLQSSGTWVQCWLLPHRAVRSPSAHWCLILDLSSIQDNMESTSILNKLHKARHFGISVHKYEVGCVCENLENWEWKPCLWYFCYVLSFLWVWGKPYEGKLPENTDHTLGPDWMAYRRGGHL